MKQIIAANEQVEIAEVPAPEIKENYILLKTMYSAISPGTESSIIKASAGKQVPLGYSAMGKVEACGDGIEDVKPGDLAACYGAPYVHHGEYLLIPKTLYAKVPENVTPQEASLAGIGAIAIHALRVAELAFGETVVIAGLGLLGQMIAKIADAAAYNVIAYDLNKKRVEMLNKATNIQAFSDKETMEKVIETSTYGHGADAVLLCAGGKRSPLTSQSLGWIRNKGKVVIVGDIEPDFPRTPMFSKEAQILISRAGGPGRYDSLYEAQAVDYPYGFVRWPEGRNVAEYLRLVNEKRIDLQHFITDEVKLEEAPGAYAQLFQQKTDALTKIIAY